jgi:hypothetical protein
VAGAAAEDGRRRDPATETGRLLVGRRLQTGSEVLDGSDHFRGLLRGGKGVKRDRETSAATNWRGGADHRRRLHGKIPAMQNSRAQLLGSGSFWMTRGSGRGGCGGLGCGGAVQPRRGRGCSAAEEKGAAALRVSDGCCGVTP